MIERIFNGRNGIDALSVFLLALSFLFMNRYTFLVSLFLIGYALFRCFSKNVYKRRAEAYRFSGILFALKNSIVKHTAGIRRSFAYSSLKMKNRKTTVYFKCPHCKKILSLPRNKGKLAVTCTVCGHSFNKKT